MTIKLWSILVFLVFFTQMLSEKQPENMAQLGEQLFFDRMLSKDYTLSCASCHKKEFAFADTTAFSLGIHGQRVLRNTPSVMNMMFRPYFFYDGRAATIQEQVMIPIESDQEMGLSMDSLILRLKQSKYNDWFVELTQKEPDTNSITEALSAFVFSLESDGSAAFDRWMRGDTSAMTAQQILGREIFNNKGKCFDCHFSPDFTGDEFRNIGLFNNTAAFQDPGRFKVTADSADIGKFKVPGLRNIAVTAPYMHNGFLNTLEEVVDYYNDPSEFLKNALNRDSLLSEPLGLTIQEKKALVAFLKALTDEQYVSLLD